MLTLANHTFPSRLLTGTGKFSNPDTMKSAVQAAKSSMVTLAMKRVASHSSQDETLSALKALGVTLLPNTSGAKNAKEAIFAAELAYEALGSPWVKLEIHPDQRYLLPDPIETLLAAEALVKKGFHVLPYCGADPVLCKRLEEVGCAAVMPLGAPIGSNQGLQTKPFLQIIVEQASIPVIVDAGIGKPSEAMAAMELGVDAVLVNTAIATAKDPVAMAAAFASAVETGRKAFEAGLGATSSFAQASSPLTAFLEPAV
ncbi:thiazole synthase [Alteromonas macleodii]|jgi:thiazole synthase|uniref:thiazole synthase n=1 Tax=Alteromonas TaxID=226 RepID=UPI000776607F|nr:MULTISPECIES: thiazole synthase [Alteromonas]MCG8494575.1 thiazole synthase [Enterobacterales bacterium]MEC7082217.1 thiazole synthase [Pseudomonadota bacterium]AMN10186.1 thiazole synthase [Alteromonas macleodii]MCH2256936.1 thiazole synthase [Alteromonas sp.]MCP4280137.1 thiazole synthase [Alteromonas sp.]|tara:strand:- start:184 stop:954 length:771 start_codon:yes stop_codon:yes gene_type:complete